VARDSLGRGRERVNLEYSGHEQIPVPKDVVWAFINDPANVASCMPDVLSSTIVDAHTFDAVVQVAVGPVRGKFNFHIVLEPQPGGEGMNMKIGGGGLGSVVDLVASSTVAASSDGGTTLVWQGTATMRGSVRAFDAGVRRSMPTESARTSLVPPSATSSAVWGLKTERPPRAASNAGAPATNRFWGSKMGGW